MLLTSNTLSALISSLVPTKEFQQLPPTEDGSLLLRPGPSQSKPTLETLNRDVFRLIALELYRTPSDLKPLSLCSRTIRNLASPVLFSRCRREWHLYPPPPHVCSFTRHLTYTGGRDFAAAHGYCKQLLERFPLLTAITFERIKSVSWAVLRVCLSHPRIVSVSFSDGATLAATDPLPIEEVAETSVTLSDFAYETGLWRSMRHWSDAKINPPCDLGMLVAREWECLAVLVMPMNQTLVHLSLSMGSAPILKMAELPWPKLRVLSIKGSYWTSEQVDSLPVLLGTLPELEELSIRICRGQTDREGRPPMLGRHSRPRSVLSGMHSLTVAYPDPDDAIFLIDTSHLRHLSLCDWPRHYNSPTLQHYCHAPFAYPILSSTECLSILQRMNMPELSSLELVYLASRAGADDDLLRHVASEFPKLAHLELHRYRADRDEEVNHVHIARLLSATRSLRAVRLNLDFHGDHGPYCGKYVVRKAWWDTFKGSLGWEIVNIMQDCPLLRCVELLYHGSPTATWVEFHPPRCAEPRFVLSYDKDHREPELMPVSWFHIYSTGPWSGDPEQDVTTIPSGEDTSESEDSTPPPENTS
ncbi:hypothetical protein OH76DRAFT_1431059 [Lentinus brumalis]|uniref:Uncharacterized protein n=1 Tax=Lentinus brumalis TaxID=2498619 RepID=A0A371DP10_9APHY|nr:hypothetical protein OH76DRAFT_1431059 [Polyporus brumalis]